MGTSKSWGALAIIVFAISALGLGSAGVFATQSVPQVNLSQTSVNDDGIRGCLLPDGTFVEGDCPEDEPVASQRPYVPIASPPPVTDGEVPSDAGTNFPPIPDYEQSCEPQRRDGCTWDIGARQGLWNEAIQRFVYQVGIVKGVGIEWNGMVARALRASDGENRCSLVVIPANTWLENITVWDANVTTYYVWAGDVNGWVETLAVQAAQEQSANYGCPLRDWPEDFDIWTSGISSPPCGVEGFDCVGPDGGTEDNSSNQQQDTQPNDTSSNDTEPDVSNPGANPGGNGNQANCASDTVDCKPRKATRDYNGELSFKKGDAVLGFKITIGGRTLGPCYYRSAPRSGTVVDGVVHYWDQERKDQHLRPCA